MIRTGHVYELTIRFPYYECTFFVPVPGEMNVVGGYFQFVPEPGGWLLLGLGGLLLRRRGRGDPRYV